MFLMVFKLLHLLACLAGILSLYTLSTMINIWNCLRGMIRSCIEWLENQAVFSNSNGSLDEDNRNTGEIDGRNKLIDSSTANTKSSDIHPNLINSPTSSNHHDPITPRNNGHIPNTTDIKILNLDSSKRIVIIHENLNSSFAKDKSIVCTDCGTKLKGKQPRKKKFHGPSELKGDYTPCNLNISHGNFTESSNMSLERDVSNSEIKLHTRSLCVHHKELSELEEQQCQNYFQPKNGEDQQCKNEIALTSNDYLSAEVSSADNKNSNCDHPFNETQSPPLDDLVDALMHSICDNTSIRNNQFFIRKDLHKLNKKLENLNKEMQKINTLNAISTDGDIRYNTDPHCTFTALSPKFKGKYSNKSYSQNSSKGDIDTSREYETSSSERARYDILEETIVPNQINIDRNAKNNKTVSNNEDNRKSAVESGFKSTPKEKAVKNEVRYPFSSEISSISPGEENKELMSCSSYESLPVSDHIRSAVNKSQRFSLGRDFYNELDSLETVQELKASSSISELTFISFPCIPDLQDLKVEERLSRSVSCDALTESCEKEFKSETNYNNKNDVIQKLISKKSLDNIFKEIKDLGLKSTINFSSKECDYSDLDNFIKNDKSLNEAIMIYENGYDCMKQSSSDEIVVSSNEDELRCLDNNSGMEKTQQKVHTEIEFAESMFESKLCLKKITEEVLNKEFMSKKEVLEKQVVPKNYARKTLTGCSNLKKSASA